MKVGDKVWKFRGYGRAPFLDSWSEFPIIGETRVSWIIGYAGSTLEHAKLNKKALAAGKLDGWATSREAIETEATRREWIGANAGPIRSMVRACEDVEKLRQIGALLGYVEPGK